MRLKRSLELRTREWKIENGGSGIAFDLAIFHLGVFSWLTRKDNVVLKCYRCHALLLLPQFAPAEET